MTGVKIWAGFTVASTLGAFGSLAGVVQQTVLTGDNLLIPAGLFFAAVSGVAVGTWKLAQAVGRLATKEDLKKLATKADLEALEGRFSGLEKKVDG